jgi:XTP/dITP diphosphohydrolase
MELILASNNKGKISEIVSLLPHLNLRTMRDAGYTMPIEEPYDTFHQNALQKARTIYEWCGKPVLADDSGLCVDALNGAPGVWSARFAGPDASDESNNNKLLDQLRNMPDRSAHYIAVICVIVDGNAQFFEGRCAGRIAYEPKGNSGFGYDPLFIPNGYHRTFGEIEPAIKSRISHRAKALNSLIESGLLAAH